MISQVKNAHPRHLPIAVTPREKSYLARKREISYLRKTYLCYLSFLLISEYEDGKALLKSLAEACSHLSEYNKRLCSELADRQIVQKKLADYTVYQKYMLAATEDRLEVYACSFFMDLNHALVMPDANIFTEVNKYFKERNIRGKKMLRSFRFWMKFTKVYSAKFPKLLDWQKFILVEFRKM